jgi:very-short-patch-repair endonuclease
MICYHKSIISDDIVEFWSQNNIVNPRDVPRSSTGTFLFRCENNHESELVVQRVLHKHHFDGEWCPRCKNKTEKMVLKFLREHYTVETQKKFDWCYNPKTKYKLPFDFVIDDHIIIELDGPQHFKQVSNWKSPELQQEIDTLKSDLAKENGYKILRLIQEDVWTGTSWKDEIISFVQMHK